jgi:hypothetical protein
VLRLDHADQKQRIDHAVGKRRFALQAASCPWLSSSASSFNSHFVPHLIVHDGGFIKQPPVMGEVLFVNEAIATDLPSFQNGRLSIRAIERH